jgi:hypothetical protein
MRKKEEKEQEKERKMLSLEEKREAKLKKKEAKDQVMLTPQKGAAPTLENPEQQKTQGQTDVASNDSKHLVEVQPFANAPPNPALQ